jgi:hypothetical protein
MKRGRIDARIRRIAVENFIVYLEVFNFYNYLQRNLKSTLSVGHFTEGAPNLSADRVRTVPFSARGRLGQTRSVPYFFDRFRDFCLKARTLPRFKFYRLNANFS